MREAILTLQDGYAAAIDVNRRLAIETVDIEAFHDLRVAAKRERALLQYIEALEPSFDARESYRLLRPLFRAAGAVRDLHIQQAIARRIAPRGARAFQRGLREKLDDALWRFSRASAPGASEWSLLRARLENMLTPIDPQVASSRIATHLQNLEKASEELTTRGGDLHELRIATKNLLYTLHFIGRSIPDFATSKEREAALQKLQRMLGNWHDLEITLAADGLPPALATSIRREKENLRRRIRQAVHTK